MASLLILISVSTAYASGNRYNSFGEYVTDKANQLSAAGAAAGAFYWQARELESQPVSVAAIRAGAVFAVAYMFYEHTIIGPKVINTFRRR